MPVPLAGFSLSAQHQFHTSARRYSRADFMSSLQEQLHAAKVSAEYCNQQELQPSLQPARSVYSPRERPRGIMNANDCSCVKVVMGRPVHTWEAVNRAAIDVEQMQVSGSPCHMLMIVIMMAPQARLSPFVLRPRTDFPSLLSLLLWTAVASSACNAGPHASRSFRMHFNSSSWKIFEDREQSAGSLYELV